MLGPEKHHDGDRWSAAPVTASSRKRLEPTIGSRGPKSALRQPIDCGTTESSFVRPLRTIKDNAPVRVAIVEDHPVARYGIQQILGADAGLEVVSAVGAVAELWESGYEADVVVLNLNPPAERVPTSEIEMLASTAAVLVFSASSHAGDVLAALDAGAGGYVTKTSAMSVFIEAVRTVGAGGCYVSAELVDALGTRADDRVREPSVSTLRLAPREREALTLIAQGFTQAQAAGRMGVSATTVDTYLTRIRTKLGPGNKADLTRRAVELGEVALPRRGDCTDCCWHPRSPGDEGRVSV